MKENIPWDIIANNLKGQATQEEVGLLNKWIEENENHLKILQEIQDIYSLNPALPPFFKPDKKKAWKKINKQINDFNFKVRLIFNSKTFAAASVFLLIVSIAIFRIYHNQTQQILQLYSEIVAPTGQKTMVMLPDSTIVWLNSGSTIQYNGNFGVKDRNVILEGEAFFEVKRNERMQFKVQTGNLSVKVYGTAFNIKNYKNDVLLEITVNKGRVGVLESAKELKQLTKGEQAVYNKLTNTISYTQTDPELISSWKNNELRFDNTPLAEVVKYMERWYGVKITMDPSMAGKHNYTFKIKTESLTEMLEKLKMMTPISYEINGKDIIIRYTN